MRPVLRALLVLTAQAELQVQQALLVLVPLEQPEPLAAMAQQVRLALQEPPAPQA